MERSPSSAPTPRDPGRLCFGRRPGGWLVRVGLKTVHRDDLEGLRVCGGEHDGWGNVGIGGFLPPGSAETPAIARRQPGKVEFGTRCAEVVAARLREREKVLGHHRANGVCPAVARPGVAVAVPVKSRHGIGGARLEGAPEDVLNVTVGRCVGHEISGVGRVENRRRDPETAPKRVRGRRGRRGASQAEDGAGTSGVKVCMGLVRRAVRWNEISGNRSARYCWRICSVTASVS